MKIAFINSFYYPDEVGGAEKSVRYLAETLAADGHEILVLTNGRVQESLSIKSVLVKKIPTANIYSIFDFSKRNRFFKLAWHIFDSYNVLAKYRIKRALAKFQPDIVHTNTIGGFSVSVWGAVKELNIPLVHTLRDYYLLCPNTAMFKAGRQCRSRCGECRILGAPRQLLSEKVDVVVGNSDFILQRHLKEGMFPKSSSRVIYNAYEARSVTDHRDPQYVTFGFIGRVAPTKGIEVLLAALRQARFSSDKKVRLLVAGTGEKLYLASLGVMLDGIDVEFLGVVEPHEFYSRIDWCIVPSLWHEPLARVLFEAFAHGVPIIASNTGGTAELVKHEVNGFTYVATDVDALAALLKRAAFLPELQYETFRDAGRKESVNFLPNRVIEEYLKCYSMLL